jgi:uncharacterized protein (TIGR04255 family)
MSENLGPLPSFDNPPVVEVALSVQFEPLTTLKAAHLGRLWDVFREQGFVRTEDHLNLEAVSEGFDPRLYARDVGIKFRSIDAPAVPRVWFLNEPGTELIQVQQNRFIHNWRKAGNDIEYVRYPRIRQQFEDCFNQFQAFVKAEALGPIVPNQCEITYTNHLISGGGWDTQGHLEQVFAFWQNAELGFLPTPENASVAISYLIPDQQGRPIGRLHVDVQPAFRSSDLHPMLILNLTARGAPLHPSDSGVMAFLDLGREWIVRGFTSITVKDMHRVWRRTDVR